MSFELGLIRWPPLRLARMCCEHASVVVVRPLVLHSFRRVRRARWDLSGERSGWTCTAISARSRSSRAARCARPVGSRRRRRRLSCSRRAWRRADRVALEVTGSAWEIARILEPHVARVVVVSPADTGIRQARAKTDRLDARALARLLAAGELDAVWSPDQRTRVLRRRLARREQLVRARTRAKNEIHAVLVRRLVGRPPVSDLFGVKGRAWLRALELPLEEAETVAACLRHVEFLDSEIAAVEREIARQALESPELRRLMTVPGVNVICAATFLAAVGDIRRFPTSRKLVGYLGLDPRVYQSGSEPAKGGRISKQGSPAARWALVEAAWSVVQQPGPLRAFYERIRGRRGQQDRRRRGRAQARGAVLVAALARRGLRPRAALADGQEAAPARDPRRRPDAQGHADRDLGDPPADAHRRARARPAGRGLLQANGPRLASRIAGEGEGSRARGGGRERDTGARIDQALKGQVARQAKAPEACSSTRHRLAPTGQPNARRTDRPARRQPPAPTAHAPKRPRIAVRRPPRRHNRPHRSRSEALRRSPATDPMPETRSEIASQALDFHRSSEASVRSTAAETLAIRAPAALGRAEVQLWVRNRVTRERATRLRSTQNCPDKCRGNG